MYRPLKNAGSETHAAFLYLSFGRERSSQGHPVLIERTINPLRNAGDDKSSVDANNFNHSSDPECD